MRARDHTRSMLCWWQDAGVDRADIAVRHAGGEMLWHHDRPLDELPLPWARALNAGRADVYVRPARGYAWALVFLDDVRAQTAMRIARKYAALVVETSAAGGCHVWLACRRPLEETERKHAQASLAQRIAADPGSVSGEHLGRLAGFKNWKRGGVWANVIAASHGPPWDPIAAPKLPVQPPTAAGPHRHRSDHSESAREWGWVCGLLEDGLDAEAVYRRLVHQAQARRGHDTERYARRTIARAIERVAFTHGLGARGPCS